MDEDKVVGTGDGEDQRIPFHRPSIDEGEINAALRVLQSGWLTTGPEAKAFEAEFADYVQMQHAVAVNSCTAALHLGLEAMDISPGDRVLTTPLTFTASAEVIRYLGADPVFADIDPRTLNISSKKIEEKLAHDDGIRAILPVHYAGLSCDMTEIRKLARKHDCRILEDAAHSFPATYDGRPVGQLGDAAAYSFYATKTLAVGEGGMLVTNDSAIADRARIMRLHGISSDVFDRYRSPKPSWYYEIVAPGFKYNLPDVAATIGRVQLQRADELRQKRESIARRYNESFDALPVVRPPTAPDQDIHAWHLYVLRLDLNRLLISRNEFIEQMAARGIGTSVHFIPLHLQPYWRDTYNLRPEDFPVATDVFDRVVSLPIYPAMTSAEVERVIEIVTAILTTHSR